MLLDFYLIFKSQKNKDKPVYKKMKILFLGDIVGPAAVRHISKSLWDYRNKNRISLVIANGENAESGNGILPETAELLVKRGVDVITSGNHIWKQSAARDYLEGTETLIRPLNYPGVCPGKGYTIAEADGYRFLVMNVQGTVYMEALACPFESVERALEINKGRYDFALLDIHAEATSEKLAIAYCFDGKINIMVGTHTHVQTADERILPKGSGYITDLGMCGVQDGILGVRSDIIIDRLRTKLPAKFALKDGNPVLCGALFELDTSCGVVTDVRRVML